MKSIQFKKHYRSYNPGETAHFAIDVADKLIAAGVAVDPATLTTAAATTAATESSDSKSGKPEKRVQPKTANAQPD
jgi:hypothetical protein